MTLPNCSVVPRLCTTSDISDAFHRVHESVGREAVAVKRIPM